MINEKLKEYTLLAAVLLAVFGVYLHTTFPAFKGDDSPETVAAAYTLGIQHAPGYPLHAMLGKIAVTASLANPAFKVNLLAAFTAVLTLLVTYFILTRHVFRLFDPAPSRASWVLGYGSIFILAFGSIFWSQAIEAKGGIYLLNLFFFSVLILLALKLLENFDIRLMYLSSYIFGLSLANHWPSMIAAMPVMAYLLYRCRKQVNPGRSVFAVLAAFAGVGAYFFLFIRAGANPGLNWGDPASFGGLFDVITRKMYAGQGQAVTGAVVGARMQYVLSSIFSEYGLLCLLALPGFYSVYKKKKEIFWILTGSITALAAALVFYTRTGIEMLWLLGVFLLPAFYCIFIFMAAGAVYVAGLAAKKVHEAAVPAVTVLLALVLLFMNFNKNDRHKDFIAYDLMHNITASAGSAAFFIPESDMYYMPMLYEKLVIRKKPEFRLFALPFLIYDWGIEQAKDIFGNFPSKPGDLLYNLAGITGIAMHGPGALYRDFMSPAFDALKLPLYQGHAGLVKRVSAVPSSESPKVYSLYSLRGIYGRFGRADENAEIITRYLIFMSLHAERLMQLLRYREAIGLYEKAMLIPADKLLYMIYFNIARCYQALDDRQEAAACLKKAIADKADFLPAYEAAGRLYYEGNDIFNAYVMFSQAVQLGSADPQVVELANSARITVAQNEKVLTEAGTFAAQKNYKQAMMLYNTLIKLEYRASDVYMRLGQLYYEQGEKDKALQALSASNKKEPNPGAYYYSAKIYFKKGMYSEAKSAALEGLARFKDDKRLKRVYEGLSKQ